MPVGAEVGANERNQSGGVHADQVVGACRIAHGAVEARLLRVTNSGVPVGGSR